MKGGREESGTEREGVRKEGSERGLGKEQLGGGGRGWRRAAALIIPTSQT